ncbi:MAG: hypothetical protein ISR45_08940 [Rhodospirillales bacterium]|nr:hypothetical protein [Rhodospirillales bacterium]
MNQLDGITHDGLQTAMGIKESYRAHEPICLPGEDARILMPENLLNHHIDLMTLEDPLVLSMMATRDPEPPMALAAATRLSPLGNKSKLLNGVFRVVGETTKHSLITKCVSMITESAFCPDAIAKVRLHANKFIISTRKEYTLALRQNLQSLLDGTIAPRYFVNEFFELTEAGNMRSDIRKKLVLSLLLSENIRPSIKFLFLENFERLPNAVKGSIVGEVMKAPPSRHMDILKEELRWTVSSASEGKANVHAISPIKPDEKPSKPKMAMAEKPMTVPYKPVKAKPRPWQPGERQVLPGSKEIPWH